ncbi:MAG: glycoside hydrolase family 3 N-terminal domain-containing protein [Pedobacter sp.]|uniref:glycoside hydrolase family 3 N-terminal domain-containing protein n=1 Tax=Pedobacter sp. TaxID=1411316 RepID=UPI00280825FE|nr:glycoside hydrolase family 3 N-terminal domain-containing protein [Pedobacter sp.]MDQ8005343.1 glycoside hydrolase family 3 N-terminal domain-containing protein [Pedobacter sp.]
MNKFFSLSLLLSASIVTHVHAQRKTIEQRVDSVMKLMTLTEKIGQLNQYSGREVTGPASDRKNYLLNDIKNGMVGSMLNVKGVKDTREIQAIALQSRLKIPLLFSLDVIHGYKTVFPIPLAESASWDLSIIRRTAEVAAEESAASGIHWTFAPMVDIARDPRWGRVMEGAGEDTYLGSQIAKARVLGFQGDKLGGVDRIMACAKHFAAYGSSMAGRDYNPVDISKQQLHEIYLPPFKAAADAGVATFMNSFNTLNGIPATGNAYLQRDILKKQWNYQGFVVSDWASIKEMTPWGFAKNLNEAAEKAIIAGSDMDMESEAYKKELEKLVASGKVDVKYIDEAVKRILYKKFELGLFDNPYKFSDEKREKKVMNDPKYKDVARAAAQGSIVLLKNNNAILPLNKSLKNIALIGPLVNAKRDQAGSWVVYADTTNIVSVYEGVKQKVKNAKLNYTEGTSITDTVTSGFANAVNAAKNADAVVMVLGENWDMSGEAKSRTDISLPGKQEELFKAVKATGKPVIVVLMAGRPLVFDSISAQADAIVYAWFLGDQGGNAIADVLFGDYNPSGKLPISFPRNVGQIPIFYNFYNTGRPVTKPTDIRYKSAYIDAPNDPQYAFGHGLSYTTFTYSDLKLSNTNPQKNETVKVSFTLTNTGKVAGEEVAQLYIQDTFASVVRPVKELKGFEKVKLKPGESKQITFELSPEKLSFYHEEKGWITEAGEFKVMVGTASNDIKLKSSFELK